MLHSLSFLALWWTHTDVPVSCLHQGIQKWRQHSSWVSPVLRGRLSSPDLLLMLLPKAGFVVRAHYWLMVTLASTRTPWFFSTKLLFSLLFPSMVHRDVPPYEQFWHFPLVKINEIPVCSFLQTVRIPSEWWNNHLVYPLLLPVLCYLQVCRCHAQVQRCSLVLENITLTSTAENLGAGPCPDLNQDNVGENLLQSKVSEEKRTQRKAKAEPKPNPNQTPCPAPPRQPRQKPKPTNQVTFCGWDDVSESSM